MIIKPFNQLLCPLDGMPLIRNDHAWICSSGHNFDIAKQGYTHLLPVQNKRSLDPGDHKEMVAARRRFLNAGYYQKIAEAVNTIILSNCFENSFNTNSLNILDAGCGEGYYLRALAAAEKNYTLHMMGVDISKWAVLSAAKQDARMNWLVASNANLPLESSSLDWVLCMFGFPVYTEFVRVLKPSGCLLQVDAGVNHLRELKDIIYPKQKPENNTAEKVPENFEKIASANVCYTLHLEPTEVIADLLAMTPHLYRATAEARAKVAALTTLDLTIDVKLTHYQKNLV